MADPSALPQTGGGGGIRTHGALAGPTVFKTGAFDRSATPPIGMTADELVYCAAKRAEASSAPTTGNNARNSAERTRAQPYRPVIRSSPPM